MEEKKEDEILFHIKGTKYTLSELLKFEKLWEKDKIKNFEYQIKQKSF